MPTMRPPMPHCQPRPEYEEFERKYFARKAWFFGPEHARASIIAGEGTMGNGINTWEVWYPGESEPSGYQSAWQIAQRMAGHYVKAAPAQPATASGKRIPVTLYAAQWRQILAKAAPTQP